MKKGIPFFLIFLIAVCVPTAVAYGQGSPRWCGRGHYHGPDHRALAQLNLTQEQTKKISDLREAHMKAVKPLQEALFSKRCDLRRLWLQPNPDAERIAKVRKEIITLRNQLEDLKTDYWLNVLKVLTPEQRERYQLFAERGHCAGIRGPSRFHHHGPGMFERCP